LLVIAGRKRVLENPQLIRKKAKAIQFVARSLSVGETTSSAPSSDIDWRVLHIVTRGRGSVA
jgi:hypothetical protein